MNEINCLEKEDIYVLHKDIVENYGGSKEYYSYTDHKIESILASQYPYFGEEKYEDIFQKAAALMYFFVKSHCFVDGNKRIGIYVATVFLDINGFPLSINNEEGYKKTVEIAVSQFSEKEREQYIIDLAEWLKYYLDK